MGLEVSGRLILVTGRSAVTTNDSTYPSGVAQAQSVAVPARAKGARTHVIFSLSATGGTPSVVCSLFGYLAATDQWYLLDNLNNGTAIDQGLSPLDDSSNIHYAEALDHAAAYDRLWMSVTSIAGTGASVTQRFCFETLHD